VVLVVVAVEVVVGRSGSSNGGGNLGGSSSCGSGSGGISNLFCTSITVRRSSSSSHFTMADTELDADRSGTKKVLFTHTYTEVNIKYV